MTDKRIVAALVLCLVAGLSATTVHAEDWSWELTPYLWVADVSLDARVNDDQIANVELGFADLVDKIDIGALVRFEGRRGRAGFFVEANYLSLSDGKTILALPPITDGTEVRAEVDLLIAEAGGFYRVLGEDDGLDVLFGARLLDLSTDVSFDFPVIADRALSSDESPVDAFAGVRYRGGIGDRWAWWARGDVGGGGTDLSWQGIVGFGVNFGKKRDDTLIVAYRHLSFEVDNDGGRITEQKVAFSGLLIGYRFAF